MSVITKNTKGAKQTKKSQTIERIANDASKLHATFDPGDVSHQGDLIIVSIGTLPRSARPRKNRQLAEGDTQGSRHVLEHGEIFDADPEAVASLILKATEKAGCACRVDPRYIGPVFVAPAEPTPDDLTHPEHGNQGFPAGTVCAVVYQRNLDAEEREQRTRD
jgi:hypothetical protein